MGAHLVSRTVSRPRRPWSLRLGRLGWVQRHGTLGIILAGVLLLPVCLFLVPRYWVERNRTAHIQAWSAPTLNYAARLLKVLGEPPDFGGTTPGDPDRIRRALAQNPLLVAYGFGDGENLQVRSGDKLVPAGEDAESRRYRRWVRLARESGGSVWNPPTEEHAEALREAVTVLHQPNGYAICRWRIGSPEVEQFLRLALGESPGLRVGLVRADPKERSDPGEGPWCHAPSVQASFAPGRTYALADGVVMDILGEGWRVGFVANEPDEVRFKRMLMWWRMEAYSTCAFLFLPLAAGLWLIQSSRRRERLERDRLASMAHGLKTPLGILMLRCDSLRLGRFEGAKAEMELARICEEVENLTAFIDQSLRGLRKAEAALRPEAITPEWFRRLAEDLSVAMEEEGRVLELNCDEACGSAHAPSLRTALITLLENSLTYGEGPIHLTTLRRGPWLRIEVRDEGPGLRAEQLANLGRPFMRFRPEGSEGFAADGRGLGLFLLREVAEQEGWGLEFASAPGQGFLAGLEIPVVRAAEASTS